MSRIEWTAGKLAAGLLVLGLAIANPRSAWACPNCIKAPAGGSEFQIESARVVELEELDAFVFEVEVAGTAGRVTPEAAGQLDGAPVLGYVFPTNLNPTSVGFGSVEGILPWL